MSVVAFGGSRGLPASGEPLVRRVVGAVLGAGRSVAVGCAAGADAAVVRSVLSAGAASRLSVFSAFGRGGRGAFGWSAVGVVRAAAVAGARVLWWAGGGPSVGLVARLLARSAACVRCAAAGGVGSGLVLFVSSARSRGSWGAARSAARCGLPVVVFLVGLPVSCLVSLGRGRWVRAGSGVWAGGWLWVSDFAKGGVRNE